LAKIGAAIVWIALDLKQALPLLYPEPEKSGRGMQVVCQPLAYGT
jgi:hypothetical protein